jgi:hypothetical protein
LTQRAHLGQAAASFVELYDESWLIERLRHRTPREAYEDSMGAVAA